MRVCRAMLVLSVMVVLIGGFSCCPPPPEESSKSNEEIAISELKEVTSKAVIIRPLNGDPDDACIVDPEELHMGPAGIEWVTFVNETNYDAEIMFVTGDAIGNVSKHDIKANQAKSLKLIDPAETGSEKKYEYSVKAECYTPPMAGPKIIIP